MYDHILKFLRAGVNARYPKKIKQKLLTAFLEVWTWEDTISAIPLYPYPNLVKILKILDDPPTLNSCNFFVFKYFLDRKKVSESP